MEIGNKWDGKKNNINAKRGCYIFIRDEFYKLKVQNMNLILVWIIQIGNREKKIKKKEKIEETCTWAIFPGRPIFTIPSRAAQGSPLADRWGPRRQLFPLLSRACLLSPPGGPHFPESSSSSGSG
jgi:hypothetical protein